MALIRNELIRDLHELIAALDRRVPQVERAGEASIARDAAALKVKGLMAFAWSSFVKRHRRPLDSGGAMLMRISIGA